MSVFHVPPFHIKSLIFTIFMSLLFSSYSIEHPQSWLGYPCLRCSFMWRKHFFPIDKFKKFIPRPLFFFKVSYKKKDLLEV